MKRLPDYHIHTHLCKHAHGEEEEYRYAAKNLKIPEICFTDHNPNPDGYDPVHRMEMAQFSVYRHMVSRLKDGKAPAVLFGVEADYYEHCERFLGRWLPGQDFDFVLGSIHYIEDWGFDNPEQRHVWESVDVTAAWKKYFDLIGRLADSRLFDAASHLDLPKKFGFRPPDGQLKEMAAPALDRIAQAGMGLEINTAGLRVAAKEIYPCPTLVSMARERDIPICFGSDAHRPEDVGAGFQLALNLVLEVGYTHYFTARSREKILHPLPPNTSGPSRALGQNIE